jgi:5-formyltetrahydrofolate cyclo-ligase
MQSDLVSGSDALAATKARVRARYRRVREDKTPQQVREASAALCARLAGWDLLQQSQRVMAYIAFRNELDLTPLSGLLPDIEWVVPRVVGKRLMLHRYDPDRLVRHRFGMLEPARDLPTVAPATLDVVLVPGVVFDRHGGRMGFGGGFYDGFLPTTDALRVGVTFDDCLVDHVPTDAHDQRMNWIVTPTQTIMAAAPP